MACLMLLHIRKRTIMRPVLFLLLFVCFGSSAYAVQRIPYYRMDSLAFLSSDIVLCEEGATVEVKKKNSSGYDYECSECSVTVIQVLQGSLKPNQQITIEIGTIFTRTFAKEALIQPTEKRSVIPKGKVLLFLNKDKEIWKPETGGVKLIFKN